MVILGTSQSLIYTGLKLIWNLVRGGYHRRFRLWILGLASNSRVSFRFSMPEEIVVVLAISRTCWRRLDWSFNHENFVSV
jgi:hypothetical protein